VSDVSYLYLWYGHYDGLHFSLTLCIFLDFGFKFFGNRCSFLVFGFKLFGNRLSFLLFGFKLFGNHCSFLVFGFKLFGSRCFNFLAIVDYNYGFANDIRFFAIHCSFLVRSFLLCNFLVCSFLICNFLVCNFLVGSFLVLNFLLFGFKLFGNRLSFLLFGFKVFGNRLSFLVCGFKFFGNRLSFLVFVFKLFGTNDIRKFIKFNLLLLGHLSEEYFLGKFDFIVHLKLPFQPGESQFIFERHDGFVNLTGIFLALGLRDRRPGRIRLFDAVVNFLSKTGKMRREPVGSGPLPRLMAVVVGPRLEENQALES